MKRLFVTLIVAIALLGDSLTHAQEPVKQVLCIGNSFTFFYDSNLRLEEIAASQGHALKTTRCAEPGYTLQRHLNNDHTLNTIVVRRFDYCFLQEQSQTPAVYGRDPEAGRLIARDAAELAERLRCYSPGVTIWFEQTWAFPDGDCGGFGTQEHFDELLRKGAQGIAQTAQTGVSPIGEAFAIARNERPDIVLLEPDQKHQSALGSYLKACVNYLLMYGEAFHGEVDNCGNDAQTCAYLRQVAERVVLK